MKTLFLIFKGVGTFALSLLWEMFNRNSYNSEILCARILLLCNNGGLEVLVTLHGQYLVYLPP